MSHRFPMNPKTPKESLKAVNKNGDPEQDPTE